MAFVEVTFCNAAGEDVSIGGSAISSSNFSSAFLAAYAFDKQITVASRWANAAGAWPAWIGYVHPVPVDVAMVQVVCDNHPTTSDRQCPDGNASVIIQYSDDGAVWTTAGRTMRHAGEWKNSSTVLISAYVDGPRTIQKRDGIALADHSPLVLEMARSASQCAQETEFGGAGVYPFKVEGLPASQKARVTLLRARDKLVARETWSAADGTGTFTGLDLGTKFIALAQDPAGMLHPCGAEHFPELPGATGGA